MRDAEKVIREINGSMAIEGMPLTDDDEERMRKCYNKEISYKDMREQLVKKHTVKQGAKYGHQL